MLASKPTIRNTRFAVGDVLELLTSGLHNEKILDQLPILEKEDMDAVLLMDLAQGEKKNYSSFPKI